MIMKLIRQAVMLVLLLAAPVGVALFYSGPASTAYASPADDAAAASMNGKAIFMEQHCNTCHSLDVDGIHRMINASSPMAGPDLTGVVAKKGADWTTKWLKHEVKIDGKTHRKTIHLNDEQLKTLVSWLEKQEKK